MAGNNHTSQQYDRIEVRTHKYGPKGKTVEPTRTIWSRAAGWVFWRKPRKQAPSPQGVRP